MTKTTYEGCQNCGCESEILIDRVGICEHCGEEIFPCSECPDMENKSSPYCSWDSETFACLHFCHSDEHVKNQKRSIK
ncbi:hypothetical protein MsAc7_17890 [Methanolapillus millepedarum]|uniref:Uncharacterized protein n=1 Tax=Methanolapillus millepedarum TaxID=3028296 RepID=A0AA96V5G1_9EURY|nr:hypothetical protein MsAc7_17890 [Methanosarcinaceae archaeon Ac7]